ncbi:MAG: L-aspartate oxidase [Microbacteriaceae bacterium]|nr:L-aspartate oxidase [Microbacteriaceae bacterium]
MVGTGIAGLIAALEASRRHDVVLVTKSELAESNTRYAQGGIAAALFDDDSVASHIADTLAAGAGLNDRHAVEVLCAEGPARVRDLIALGVRFDRDANGALARGREAAHSQARVIHANGDATGLAIELALIERIRRSGVAIHERTFMRDLVVREGRVAGVSLLADGVNFEVDADAVILASGGAGHLYTHTTNPSVATGDGVAAALRAGAALGDLEFYQFHPTSLAVPGNPLISEAVRGEGAVLLSADGERFMQHAHPDAELATRDVVARGIADQMAAQGGAPVLLDATALGGAFLERRFPGLTATTRAHGFDWGVTPIPVTPAAHYWMGGIRTDDVGRTSLPGLFAVGEAANTGVHGANRLASNSLLESLVFAWRAAAALDAPPPSEIQDFGAVDLPDPGVSGTVDDQTPEFSLVPVDRSALQRLMWDAAGITRDGATLAAAARTLASWTVAGDTVADLEHRNLLDLARAVVRAALDREESRGAHYRRDFPATSPAYARRLTFAQPVLQEAHA